MQLFFDPAHVPKGHRAEIESGASVLGDDVCARTAFDDVRVHADPSARIIPAFEARDLARQLVDGIDAFLGSEPGVCGSATHDQLRLANSFTRSFQETLRAERGLEHKDGVAAPRFLLDQFTGSVAADLLVGSPQEDDALGEWDVELFQCLESEERLNEARLHVKNTRTVGLADAHAERHEFERATRVHRIVMSEDEQLACRFPGPFPPRDAEMIAAMALRQDFDAGAAVPPFLGEQAAAAVRGGFLQARRFCKDEPPQRRQHLRGSWFQRLQQRLRQIGLGHGAQMLATRPTCGKGGREALINSRGDRGQSRFAATPKVAYNEQFADSNAVRQKVVCGDTERADDSRREWHPEDIAAPLSISDGGCDPRNGAVEADCRH